MLFTLTSSSGFAERFQIPDREIDSYSGIIERELGPVIGRSKIPATYDLLDKMVEQLSLADERVRKEHTQITRRILVVDSPKNAAFVLTQKSGGTSTQENVVVITTGMMQTLVGKPGDSSFQIWSNRGISNIAGMLAIKLAIPFDVTGSIYNEDFRKYLGSAHQSAALKGDHQAMRVLEEAGYPREAAYNANRLFFKAEDNSSTAGKRVRSFLPQQNLRLTGQELGLTLERYERGIQTPTQPSNSKVAVIRELRALNPQKSRKWKSPMSFQGAYQRFRDLHIELDVPEADRILESNRLLIWIDDYLHRAGDGLSETDRATFKEFVGTFQYATKPRRDEKTWIWDRNERTRYFTKENGSLDLIDRPSHSECVATTPAYQNVEILEKDFEGLDLRELSLVVSTARMFEEQGDTIARIIVKRSRWDTLYARGDFSHLARDIRRVDPEFELRFVLLFHEKVLPTLNHVQRNNFFLGATDHPFDFILPQVDPDYERASANRKKAIHDFLIKPGNEALLARYKKVLNSVWKDRGRFGVLDFMGHQAMDWDFVWEVLEIRPEEGRRQLNASVREFLRSEQYGDLLKASTEKDLSGKRFNGGKWADGDLLELLQGKECPNRNFEEADKALRKVAQNYLSARDNQVQAIYRQKLRAAFASRVPVSTEQVNETHAKIVLEMPMATHWESVLAEEIANSKMAATHKETVLREILLEGKGHPDTLAIRRGEMVPDWHKSESGTKRVAAVLTSPQVGILPNVLSVLTEYAKQRSFTEEFSIALQNLEAEATKELEELGIGKKATGAEQRRFFSFVHHVLDPENGKPGRHQDTPTVKRLKALVLNAGDRFLARRGDKMRLFQMVTATGAQNRSDDFFRSLYPETNGDGTETLTVSTARAVRDALEKGRLHNSNLKAQLAGRLIEGKLGCGGSCSRSEKLALLSELHRWTPERTPAKDVILEKIAIRTGMRLQELKSLIEPYKSYSTSNFSPILTNMGSAASEVLQKLSPQGRQLFLDYIIDPEGKDLPDEVVKQFEAAIYADLLEEKIKETQNRDRDKGTFGKTIDKEELRRTAQTEAVEAAFHVARVMGGASPFEKIPVTTLLLNSGDNLLADSIASHMKLAEKYLSYERNTDKWVMLETFLEIIPEEQRASSMAYMLSHAGEDKSSIKNLFEVFQTLGIKFGQLSSILQIFGPEIAEETKGLKENARPLSLYEIEKIMEAELSTSEKQRILRIVEIKASAGIACAVSVLLHPERPGGEPRPVIMLVRRPHIHDQVDGNIDLSTRYVERLRQKGLDIPGDVDRGFIQDVHDEVKMELDFRRVAARIGEAADYYEALNHQMKGKLNGYTYEVPAIRPESEFAIRSNLLFMGYADGVSWDKLDESTRLKVGEPIVVGNLRWLFRRGRLNVDPHGGNYLIGTNKIYPIDYGQVHKFSVSSAWGKDERMQIVNLLRAIQTKNENSLIRYAIKMARQRPSLSPAQQKSLRQELSRVLRSSDSLFFLTRNIRRVLGEHGIVLKRKFSFGLSKTLLITHGEEYLGRGDEGERRLISIIGRESRHVLRQHPVQSVTEAGIRWIDKCNWGKLK